MKHTIHKDAVCPFYKHEDSQVIYCDGIAEGTVLHLAFASKTSSKSYKTEHCRDTDGWQNCPIAKLLGWVEKGGSNG